MAKKSKPRASSEADPICLVCLQAIKAQDRVRGSRDELIHEACDYTRSAPGRLSPQLPRRPPSADRPPPGPPRRT